MLDFSSWSFYFMGETMSIHFTLPSSICATTPVTSRWRYSPPQTVTYACAIVTLIKAVKSRNKHVHSDPEISRVA